MSTIRSEANLQLGFALIPVSVVTSSGSEKGPTLHTYCTGDTDGTHDPIRVNQTYNCPTCERAGGRQIFAKGQDVDGKTVILTDDEIAAVAGAIDETTKDLLVITTHDASDVMKSTVPSGKFYYLKPGKKCPPPFYAALAKAIADAPETAFVTRFTARSAPGTYRLVTHNGIISLEQLTDPQDMHEAPAVPTEFNEVHVQQMLQVADGLKTEFDPEKYTDTRRHVLDEVLAASTGVPTQVKVATKVDPTDNLMALLTQSLEALPKAEKPKKPALTGGQVKEVLESRKAPAKKAAAKKPVRKSA